MTNPATAPTLDATAVARWPLRAGAHLLGLGLVAAVVAALPVAPTDLDRHQLPKELAVHLATWCAVLLVRPLPVRLPGRALRLGLVVFLAATVASALLATNLWLALRATSLSVTLAAAFVTAWHLAGAGCGRVIMGWVLVAGAAGVGGGLAQAYGLASPLFAATRVPGGTFGNRNFLAHFCALVLSPVLLGTLTSRRRVVTAAGLLLAMLLLGAIVLTRSRAAWLGTILGGGVLLLALRRAGPLALPIVPGRPWRVAAALALGAVLAITVPNTLNWRSASPYSDTLADLANHEEGSGRGRKLQYRHSLELAGLHPVLGVGPGNWPIRYGETAPPDDPSWVPGDVIPLNPWPSSDWVALISERGAIALLAVLLVGITLALHAWRGIAAGGARAIAGAGLAAMMATWCVQGLFDAVALLPAPGYLMALCGGVLLLRADGETAAEGWRATPPSRWNLLFTLLLGLIALRSASQTAAYVVAGNGRMRGRLEMAARIDPGSYALRIALAGKGSCRDARAAVRMAPLWPAARAAARRCGSRE